jgi:hypothetical protein
MLARKIVLSNIAIRRFAAGPRIKDDDVGAQRRDWYSDDVFKVTDDGIIWSYESKQKIPHSPARMGSAFSNPSRPSQTKSLSSAQMARIQSMPARVGAPGQNMSRADILNMINTKVAVASNGV